MIYTKNDIVTFKDLENTITGVIQGEEGEHYHVKGMNGKTYFILEADIISFVGKARQNEARFNAEEWEREK